MKKNKPTRILRRDIKVRPVCFSCNIVIGIAEKTSYVGTRAYHAKCDDEIIRMMREKREKENRVQLGEHQRIA